LRLRRTAANFKFELGDDDDDDACAPRGTKRRLETTRARFDRSPSFACVRAKTIQRRGTREKVRRAHGAAARSAQLGFFTWLFTRRRAATKRVS
jgi:hypothetical protein